SPVFFDISKTCLLHLPAPAGIYAVDAPRHLFLQTPRRSRTRVPRKAIDVPLLTRDGTAIARSFAPRAASLRQCRDGRAGFSRRSRARSGGGRRVLAPGSVAR